MHITKWFPYPWLAIALYRDPLPNWNKYTGHDIWIWIFEWQRHNVSKRRKPTTTVLRINRWRITHYQRPSLQMTTANWTCYHSRGTDSVPNTHSLTQYLRKIVFIGIVCFSGKHNHHWQHIQIRLHILLNWNEMIIWRKELFKSYWTKKVGICVVIEDLNNILQYFYIFL